MASPVEYIRIIAQTRWRLDCQDRIGIVTGYEVVYCPINDESDVDKSCPSGNYTRKVELPDAEKTNLTEMVPWTPYKVTSETLYPSQGSRVEMEARLTLQLLPMLV